MKVERFLKRQEVESLTGYSRSSIYRLIELGEFPRPIAFHARAVRWRESDVAAWQQRMINRAEQGRAA